ncbi:MAG: hypothetical protein K8L91_10480 [Anaerolineae bacterium]|nr:hypothetical protein [Anaerolineae bacterium]
MTPARRFIVRTSLVTGSTIATIVGAQSLALLDLQATTQADAVAEPTQAVNTEVVNVEPTIITESAPSITIIRRPANQTTANVAPAVSSNPSSVNTTASGSTPTNQVTSQIMPPNPIQSQPVTISMPQQPTTRSSR